jgi:ApaG protein
MPAAVTRGILVEVVSAYVPERSSPDDDEYFFAYTVRIANGGGDTVQLIDRHWIITDGTGHVEEVRGPGVVGKQPTLGPGEHFQYTSACPLPTRYGSMRGSYGMVLADGTRFEVAIPTFELEVPADRASRLLN